MATNPLLCILPLPPPYGGMSIISRSLFDAGLADHFEVIHLNTSKNSPTEKFGKITLQDVVLAIKNYIKLTLLCIRHPKVRTAFLIGTCDTGIIRDSGYIFILKLFSRKIVLNLHGTRKFTERNRLIRGFTRYAINCCDLILSPTKIDMEGVKKLMPSGKRLKLFYNSTFIKSEYREVKRSGKQEGQEGQGNREEGDAGIFRIVGLGRLSAAKGAFDLMEVCADLMKEGYDMHLTWIGKGAFPEDDRRATDFLAENQEIADRIVLHAGISEEKKYHILRGSDLFALPSYSDNLPVAILEAMAMGLPVISTAIGAIPEVIVEKTNGWLITPGDKKTLREYIIEAHLNRTLLVEMGRYSRRFFEKTFDSSQRINELKEYAAELANNVT